MTHVIKSKYTAMVYKLGHPYAYANKLAYNMFQACSWYLYTDNMKGALSDDKARDDAKYAMDVDSSRNRENPR